MQMNDDESYFPQESYRKSQFCINVEPQFSFQDFLDLNMGKGDLRTKEEPRVNMFYEQSQLVEEKQLHCEQNIIQGRQDIVKDEEQNQMNNGAKRRRKAKKNQYDKNIFANITTIIVKKMLNPDSQSKLHLYCEYKQFSLKTFLEYFKQAQRTRLRFGTTQFARFYSDSQIEGGLKDFFSMFLVGFLQRQYPVYILREGKMSNKEKYLRCASKMMYIPQLSREDYNFIGACSNEF